MVFPYREVFQETENTIITYGSHSKPAEDIRMELNRYMPSPGRELTDDLCFSILVDVVFYSGFRAAIVTARREAIHRWFPNWRSVAEYTEKDVNLIMADPGIIRYKKEGCRVHRECKSDPGTY
jgi:DNA-3-methyladenine glycosylase I